MTWSWTLLRAGRFGLDGGSMFGVVPKVLWARSVSPDEQNRIPLQTNCLLLERDGRRVLVETGYGDKWGERERGQFAMERRDVRDALAERGVAPEAIDAVLVTHLHFDHAGGLTTLRGEEAVPAFPNAELWVQRQEWEDARANKSTMTRTYLRSHLDPIADRVRLLDGEAEPLPGLRVLPVPGHTWGQQAVLFQDDEGTLCFPGDVLPTAAHAGSAYNMAYDMLPYENMRTKEALLARAAKEGWRLVLDHEPGEPVRRVVPHPERPDRMTLPPA